jgi:hypothetical protein
MASPVPFARDVVPPMLSPVLEATIGGEKITNYGYNPSPGLAGVEFISKSGDRLTKFAERAASGDDMDSSEMQYYLKTAILTVAYTSPFLAASAPALARATTFPARQVWTTIEGFWDWLEAHPDANWYDAFIRNPQTAD